MIQKSPFLLNLFKPKTPKLPQTTTKIPHNLIHSTPQILNPHFSTTHFADCENIHQLNQNLAQIIKAQTLEQTPFAFHYNHIIRSYLRLEYPYICLRVYKLMTRAGVSPDSYTLPIVLKAVNQSFEIGLVRQMHVVAIVNGLESNEFCESGIIGLYGKAGEFRDAQKVLDGNVGRKLGSWNALIGVYARGGHVGDAIELFLRMRKGGVVADDVTMVSVMSACGSVGDLKLAVQLHKYVVQVGREGKSEMLMLSSLVDMYGKCGRMDMAYRVFRRMRQRNVSTWTSLITGYAAHGYIDEALECFQCMREEGVRPNYVTFVAVLTACVHGGLVEKGRMYFDMMKNEYGIRPMVQHFGAMVDLLGRAGLLDEARKMVERMPMEPNAVIWGCLLGACEKYGDVKMGEWVAKYLVALEPWNDGIYVVLSNIYAGACMWEDVERMRQLMKERRVEKIPGYSFSSHS